MFGRKDKRDSSRASSSRAAVSKKSRPIRDAILPWPTTEQMDERLKRLVTRRIVCTKHIHFPSLDRVGLTARIRQFLNNVSWEQFSAMTVPTYKELTLEFLASLECALFQGKDEELGIVRFRLLGQNYEMPVGELNNYFGFSSTGTEYVLHGKSLHELWYTLTTFTNYNSSQSKASNIKDPTLRYLHRFMVGSIFGRGMSVGVCAKSELYILHAMVTGEEINTAFWMMNHMLRVTKQPKGDICIGGLVTILATQMGLILDETQLTRIEGKPEIDLEVMQYMGVCKRHGRDFILLEAGVARVAVDEEAAEEEEHHESDDNANPAPQFPSHDIPSSSSHHQNVSMHDLMSQLQQMQFNSNQHFATIESNQQAMLDQFRGFRSYAEERFDALDKRIDKWGPDTDNDED